jgi:hypothetical protein
VSQLIPFASWITERSKVNGSIIIKGGSLCLPKPVYDALREAAFKDGCKIHDLVMQGIDLALRKGDHPSISQVMAAQAQTDEPAH